MEAMKKISLLLVLIIVLLCILVVETKTFKLLVKEHLREDLHNAKIAAKTKDLINFTESRKRFVLSLHYNGSHRFLFVNAVKMYQFKVKDSEIKPYSLCLCNISKDIILSNIKRNRIKGNG